MLPVTRADLLEIDARPQMSVVFAEGFTQWLGFFSTDKGKIARAFAHMFVLDQFYVAAAGSQIAGMVACTDCKTSSVKLNPRELRKHLGLIKGSIAGMVLKKEFERPFTNPPPQTGSIEFVGTASEFRGQGVASQIIRYIIENTPYQQYLIKEVADTNTPAMRLYEKLGFIEYQRTPVAPRTARKIGINHFVSLRYGK